MKKTLKDLKLKESKVLVRLDLNVPLNKKGNITDSKRIIEAIPTIKFLLEKKSKIIIISHLGRPDGKYNSKLSLNVVAKELKKLLNMDVQFIHSKKVIDDLVLNSIESLNPGEILLLENIRFRKEEEENDRDFSEKLASFADFYVLDAFGTAHRKHASTYGVCEFIPSAIGFLVENEIKYLNSALNNPRRPFCLVLGGAKVSDKIKIVRSFLDKADSIIIGGGMAYTFLKAKGVNVGRSLVDTSFLEEAKQVLIDANDKSVLILLPKDVKAAVELNKSAVPDIFDIKNIPTNYIGLDIGPKTIEYYVDTIMNSNTILMNGPMGVFEMPEYADGTKAVLEAMANNSETTIVGGGDSATASNQFDFSDKMTFVSTGGGATLKYLETGDLPCISVISDK